MAIKNRFYKTTVGVPFELVVAKQFLDATTHTTNKAVIANAVDYDFIAYTVGTGATSPIPVPVGGGSAALAAAYRKKPIYFAVATNQDTATGLAVLKTTVPLRADTITAELIAYTAPAFQVSKIIRSAGTISTNQILEFKIIETTPGNTPLPTWDYSQPLTTSAVTAWTAIRDKINLLADQEFFTAALVTDGIQLTSTDANRHFKLVATVSPTRADPADYNIIFTYSTSVKPKAGSGTLDQVLELMREDNIRRGITHYFPTQNDRVTAASFGLPIDTATGQGTTTFDIVVLSGFRTEWSPTPKQQHINKAYVFIALPAGSGAEIIDLFNF